MTSFISHLVGTAKTSGVLGGLLLALTVASPALAAPPERESTRLEFAIVTSEDVNPDPKARPSPIEIRIYELKNPQAFEQADYQSLSQKDAETLGGDLLRKDGFILRPGERRDIDRKSDAETTAIGVLAGYRELGKTIWRVVYRLEEAPETAWYRKLIPNQKARLDIRLDALGVQIKDRDKTP
ncbi:type VI secretion system lipoprotein TssJ [Azonexus sp.]|jgi:type VI secretion system protein VasD|uniref:type VI secretion system lipoprotein TssJ n=1 Tax=Azonexus sp. TaxID=1872668 RepID=UPI002824BBF3|nr:type VI secretion system lipoprotein TssJ [Azonexus sp.]MDR1996501.1 type VI secretion system lipoprotein TssJ [Azonexus sp.]